MSHVVPRPVPARSAATSWHARDAEHALAGLGTPAGGLSASEAAERLAATGPNVTGGGAGEPLYRLLLRQLANPLIAVLLVSGTVAVALGDAIDGAVVFAVVVANTLIGFLQEWRAGRAIAALDAMIPELAGVTRAGARVRVPAAEVVPGDLLELAAGERVAADARVVVAHRLEIDESPLTGESLPVAKSELAVAADAVVADRTCMVHGGTLVTTGTATAVVVATGGATELGRIAGLLDRTTAVATPLTRRLGGFARWLSVAICVIAAALVVVALRARLQRTRRDARGHGARRRRRSPRGCPRS